jgi:hypothetical protein
MRTPILTITIALGLAAPCTALADKKKSNTSGEIKHLQYNMNSVQASGGRRSSDSKIAPLPSPMLSTTKVYAGPRVTPSAPAPLPIPYPNKR